jgi:hypothetical protein
VVHKVVLLVLILVVKCRTTMARIATLVGHDQIITVPVVLVPPVVRVPLAVLVLPVVLVPPEAPVVLELPVVLVAKVVAMVLAVQVGHHLLGRRQMEEKMLPNHLG